MEAHLLDENDFERVARVVSRVESTLFGSTPNGQQAAFGPTVRLLKVQSGSTNGFGYPAKIQKWDRSTGADSNLSSTTVRVIDPNGGTFAADDYVLGLLAGVNEDGVGCFKAVPAGTSGSGLTYVDSHTGSFSSSSASGTETHGTTYSPAADFFTGQIRWTISGSGPMEHTFFVTCPSSTGRTYQDKRYTSGTLFASIIGTFDITTAGGSAFSFDWVTSGPAITVNYEFDAWRF